MKKLTRRLILILLSFASLLMPLPGWATLATEPVLKLETGQHTAPINRIDIDHEGRYAVTGSHDKTARIWSLPDGKLLTVLRPPVGEGHQGKVFAVAMSPDGNTVALGGWMSASDTDVIVYLFDRQTGRLRHRLTGLENAVLHLTFSPDGRYLAAGLGRDSGIRVWRMDDRELVLRDTDYKSDVYGLDFASDGRLAATSFDGSIRLYSAQFQRLAEQPAPDGQQPYGIVFSPGGERLAVGYHDTTNVSVFSAQTLQLEFAPDTAGITSGNLMTVAWSADGQALFAAGRYQDNGKIPVLRWAAAGRGARTVLPAAGNTIMSLKPYGRSGVIFAAADPAFGILDDRGQPVLIRGPEIPNLRGKHGSALTVSSDGSSVRFGLQQGEQQAVRFDLVDRRLQSQAPQTASLQPPRVEAPGIQVSDWQDAFAPKLNGTALALEPYEMSRSLAIAPDGQRFVLGADWSLRLFDKKGTELWQKPVPDVLWGVNISGDGRLLVAAYGDGTVRWHRLSDGEELLALFVHPDGKRWVLWTPQGYYDAAPGADRLIGWHVNRGPEQAADFYAAAQFQERFYRPAVIAQVLQTLDVNEAVRLAAAATSVAQSAPAPAVTAQQPPVIDIASPANGAEVSETQLTVTYHVRSPGGSPVKHITATANGRPIATGARTPLMSNDREETGTLALTLPAEDATIALLATTEFGQTSQPATLDVRWRGAADAHKPVLYLLAIGVRQYKTYDPLKFADRDAEEFIKRIQQQKGRLYKDVQVMPLLNEQADGRAIKKGFDWIRRQTTQHDVAIVFISGHGINDYQGEYYLLPHDVEAGDLYATGIAKSEINRVLNQTAGKLIIFLDTCYAGGAKRRSIKGGAQADINGVVNELAKAGQGAVVFASSTGNQVSVELDEFKHGAFTKALLEGLDGKADLLKDGFISTSELDAFVSQRVKELTNGEQMPTTVKPDTTPDLRLFVAPRI
ncbi:MAG: caspase family protein [Nitrosomonas sp.]|uniref:caspase family protein n=1 Tax=Nitrosomonas sp. TaxID=42353 RepID=UPI001DD06BD0|nr:caspase family protein [Nitrosomonas sp.]MBX9894681.1 caspase family protein [Nitrosomonas sp.]